MKKIFQNFRNLEHNASWTGQIIGLLLFYICFRVAPLVVIIVMATIFGDGNYADFGTIVGIITGVYIYYKVLKKYSKTVNED